MMIELTVPWESRCDEAYERERAKYAELQNQCIERGWRAWLLPVEVGARDFRAQSLWKMFSTGGITGGERKRTLRKLSLTAERASSWLWLTTDT